MLRVGTGLLTPIFALERRLSWTFRMAYFRFAGRAAEPNYETGMMTFDNGVGADLLLEFGDFTVRAHLIRLEMGERPSCST